MFNASMSRYKARQVFMHYTVCTKMYMLSVYHREDRVSGFLSSRPNRLPPPPQASVAPPPPFGSGRGHTRLRERGRREQIRTRGQTLWLSRYSIMTIIPLQYGVYCVVCTHVCTYLNSTGTSSLHEFVKTIIKKIKFNQIFYGILDLQPTICQL